MKTVRFPVEVQWAVRWVGEDLWWEGFVEQVSFKSGMEETGSDGWYDGGDRWWMRLTEWGWKIIPKTGWCITERTICDLERKMMVDEWWWWVMTNECGQEAEQRSGYGDQQVERWRESCRPIRARESYIRCVRWLLASGEIWELEWCERTWELQQLHEQESSGCVEAAVSGGDCNIGPTHFFKHFLSQLLIGC